jgi:gamma-butyrobetaine dioxygenase
MNATMTAVDNLAALGEPGMSDLAPLHTDRCIARLDYDAWGVTATWDDGRRSHFHALLLRDNCACPQCRHPQALERTYMFIDHAAPVISSATLGSGDVVEVRFAEGEGCHVSRYSKGWLRKHACSPDALLERQPALQLWGTDVAARLPTVEYDDYMHTDAGLRAWIEAWQTHGIVLLRGVPEQSGKLLDVARRIGPVRASNFGEYYDVVSMPNPNASAYTAMGLELHTDLANWRSPPDAQLLFCLKNTATGGESVFADGFKVAQDLRVADPAAFALLSSNPVEFRFHDASCDIRASAPTIALDHEGRVTRVRFNNWLRSTMIVPEPLVGPLYSALEKFWRMLRDPRNNLNLRLEPGNLIAYNNNRVLHGRRAFDARSGERHLQGCYLNQEDLESILRLLDRARS